MADMSKLDINGTTYDVKDTTARSLIETLQNTDFVKATDIINNLTSTSTVAPLSANQGNQLNINKIDNVTIAGNVVNFMANGTIKCSITLPVSESGEIDLSGYVTKEVGNASQITFSDGQTFQYKLDAGTLKGDKGDTGAQGVQGEKGDTGATGVNGKDGLTTAVSVNGSTYTHVNGTVTLPNYPTVISSASGITINDTGNNFTSTNVENALAELYQLIQQQSNSSTNFYSITNNLTNVTSDNSTASIVKDSSYTASLTANSGYTLSSVTIVMGGTDITNQAYSNGNIYIGSVTGNIVITATATVTQTSTFEITSISGGSYLTTESAKIYYSTTETIVKHEFSNNAYNDIYYYSDGTDRVSTDGNGNYILTFNPGDLSAGTKNGSLRLTNESGVTALASYQLIISEPDTTILEITSITAGTFTDSENVTITYSTSNTVTKHEFNMHTENGDVYSDGTSRVTSNGNNHTMTFTAGELSAGTKYSAIRVTDADGNTAVKQFTLIITATEEVITLAITSISGGTYSTSEQAKVTYTTNLSITKHEFNLHYDTLPSSFTESSSVTDNGNNSYTITFAIGDLTEGTKNGAIRVTDSEGNTAIATFTLVITAPSTTTELAISSIVGGTYSTNEQAKITYITSLAVTKHEFNLHYDTAPDSFTDGTSRITDSGSNHYTMTFNVGDLSEGTKYGAIRVTDADGNTAIATFTLIITTETTTASLEITSISGGTYTVEEQAKIIYNTNLDVVKHEFNLHYDTAPDSFTDGTSRVSSSNNTHTMTFNVGDLSEGTKNGAIRVTDSDGNTAIKEFTLVITSVSSSTPTTLAITSISGGTYTTAQQAKITYITSLAVTKHEFIMNYSGSSDGFTDGTSRVTSSGNTHTMTFNAGDLLEGTKNGAIRVTDSSGNTALSTFTLVITSSSSEGDTGGSDTTSTAIQDWDCFNNTYGNYVAYLPSQVAVSGKKIKMTAKEQTVTVTPIGGTGSTTTKNYISGAMVTKKAFKYGTFTFKFRLSANNTYLWSMIWTLPDDVYMVRPEFDLLESWGSKTNNSIVQTYHTYDSAGTDLTNYKQAMTPVDLTQEHTLKAEWTTDNVFKMYVDGVLKLTLSDYMVNYKTGEVDYQVWFLNLGLGTYDGIAPNGVGWFEVTDYSFEPVYVRDRVKQHYWCGNWTDGTLPSGTY